VKASDEKIWQPTVVQNLVRYAPSGTYFARLRVGGETCLEKFENRDVFRRETTIADTLRDHRSKIESLTAFAEGKMTVGNAADVYLQKIRASILLKPRSKEYRELMMDFIRRSWPSLFETEVRKVSPRDCELWLSRYQQRYSPSVINNSIGTLRAIFDQAIGCGARSNNLAAGLSRVKIRQKRLELPSQSILAAKLQIAGFDISRSGVSKIEARLSYVDDKALLYLAEVLKVQVQELFPARPPGNRIYDFIDKLETTRF